MLSLHPDPANGITSQDSLGEGIFFHRFTSVGYFYLIKWYLEGVNKLGQSCAKLRQSFASYLIFKNYLRSSSIYKNIWCPLARILGGSLLFSKIHLRWSSTFKIFKFVFCLEKYLRSPSTYKNICGTFKGALIKSLSKMSINNQWNIFSSWK